MEFDKGRGPEPEEPMQASAPQGQKLRFDVTSVWACLTTDPRDPLMGEVLEFAKKQLRAAGRFEEVVIIDDGHDALKAVVR